MTGAPVGTRVPREDGSTAVEYGLVVGTVGLATILAGPELLAGMLSLLSAVVDTILGGTP